MYDYGVPQHRFVEEFELELALGECHVASNIVGIGETCTHRRGPSVILSTSCLFQMQASV